MTEASNEKNNKQIPPRIVFAETQESRVRPLDIVRVAIPQTDFVHSWKKEKKKEKMSSVQP